MADETETGADDAPLEHVVDDLTERRECEAYVYEAIAGGRAPEEVVEELVAEGWDRDDVEIMAEAARRATRHERGVVTRDDVMREANRRYRRIMGGGMLAAFPTMMAFKRLYYGLKNLMT